MTFKQVADSVYNPNFYQRVWQGSGKSAFAYYFQLAFWLTILSTALFGLLRGPDLLIAMRTGIEELNLYPAGLEVTIKDGVASTNQAGPTIIPLGDAQPKPGEPLNLLVIDTSQRSVSLEQFRAYQTYALLTANTIMFGQNEEVRVRSLDKISNLQITEAKVDEWQQKLSEFANRWFWLAVLLGFAILSFIGYLFKLAYLLLASVLIYLVAKLKKVPLTYGGAYKVGLYAITLPLIITSILPLLLTFALPPFVFTLILLVVVAINVKATLVPVVTS